MAPLFYRWDPELREKRKLFFHCFLYVDEMRGAGFLHLTPARMGSIPLDLLCGGISSEKQKSNLTSGGCTICECSNCRGIDRLKQIIYKIELHLNKHFKPNEISHKDTMSQHGSN